MNKVLMLFVLSLMVACSSPAEKKEGTQTVSLRWDWVTNMNFVGDVYAMKETASEQKLEIRCEQAGFGVDPVRLVLTGTDDFGIVSLEQLYMANERGADLVAIGIINDLSPTVLLAKGRDTIKRPQDLEGKRVGINPGGATEFVYRALVRQSSIDKAKIKEIPVDFDLKNFINDQYDIRLAFAFIEPLDLELASIEYSMLKPIDFGVKFPGRVYFTRRETIIQKPELVQAFINSVAKGWEMALSNRGKSIEYLKAFDDKIDVERETKSLDLGAGYFKGFNEKVLSFDMPNLLQSAGTLVELGVIKQTDFSMQLDDSFINRYHNGNQ